MNDQCGCITETSDDIADGVVLVVSQCALHAAHSADLDRRLYEGLDLELDHLVSAAARGKRCERIWKDGPP